jgi:hypothetical protein
LAAGGLGFAGALFFGAVVFEAGAAFFFTHGGRVGLPMFFRLAGTDVAGFAENRQ